MLSLEVLIGKLLSVDRFASSALFMRTSVFCVRSAVTTRKGEGRSTHITSGEIATLKHEVRNDAVEF